MSYVTIWCDQSPTSDLMACGQYVDGDTTALARSHAEGLGWTVSQPAIGTTYGRRLRRDYCPDHAALEHVKRSRA